MSIYPFPCFHILFIFFIHYSCGSSFSLSTSYSVNTPALRTLSSRKSIMTAATAQSVLYLHYELEDREILIGFLEEVRNFLLLNTSRQVPLYIQPPIRYITSSISSEVKWKGSDTDHLPPFSTGFKNLWSYIVLRTTPSKSAHITFIFSLSCRL